METSELPAFLCNGKRMEKARKYFRTEDAIVESL